VGFVRELQHEKNKKNGMEKANPEMMNGWELVWFRMCFVFSNNKQKASATKASS